MSLLKKVTVMAFLGALGAAAGAVLGEGLFLGATPARTEPRTICLLFDISGSMNETVRAPEDVHAQTQLAVLKEAARDFIARQDLSLDSMGLAVFATGAHVVTPPGHDPVALQRDVKGLMANGGTNLGRGFDVAATALAGREGQRFVLVFSDGKPESSSTRETPEAAALSAAARLRESGVQIIAIGTGLADAGLLAEAAGSPQNVLISDPKALNDAFKRSEEIIDSRQMLASTAVTAASFRQYVIQTGAWVALVAVGTALGLVIGQNRHLRRRAVGPRDGVLVVLGGLLTGLVVGAAGQTIYYVLSSAPSVAAIGRVVSWTLLGGGIGYGMGFFVPNVNRKRAALAGAAGGLAAAFCFLTLVPAMGDTIGRMLGAALVGLAAGLTIVLVELVEGAVYGKAWLVVHWGPKEKSTLLLGPKPILVGRSSEAHVLIADADSPQPIMARIRLDGGTVRMEEGRGGAVRTLHDGDELTYGRIRIEVRAAAGGAPEAARVQTKAAAREAALRQAVKGATALPAKGGHSRAGGAKWYQGT